jgi:transglutaminase-like putative cysteine protease
MDYQITHITTYNYDRAVKLSPHVLRLRPRCDVSQTLHKFSQICDPPPQKGSENLDLDGNNFTLIWFDDREINQLQITTISQVTTHRNNPFDFLLEPWATQLPIDYPHSLAQQLSPYLQSHPIDPIAHQLAQEIWLESHGNTITFLTNLNQTIYQQCSYLLREKGDPFPPAITWKQRAGSCRDFSVLFMAACRAVGLAARFVSGYEQGDPKSNDNHLHAWVEVYLPGGGWRGYDPTHGLAVSDTHIALVASPHSHKTTPIFGTIRQGMVVKSQMKYQLQIRLLNSVDS